MVTILVVPEDEVDSKGSTEAAHGAQYSGIIGVDLSVIDVVPPAEDQVGLLLEDEVDGAGDVVGRHRFAYVEVREEDQTKALLRLSPLRCEA